MMQQPVFPHEHAGNPGQQQQMLLCPVRLVYETQILVQPGDKIQPNQTILINPPTHHQPPWAQNRLQNQVIYVQNMPNNYLPSVQQHMDQNQMFLQQNYGFPQVIQRPMIAAPNQEPIQTALQVGNVSANIQSQIQANIAQFIPNDRLQVTNNYGHVQLNQANPQAVQNQIANVPINANNRQIQVNKTVSEIQATPAQEASQNYRQLVNQHISHMNLARMPMQQAITMLPMSSMVQKTESSQAQQLPNPNQAVQSVQMATPMQVDPRKSLIVQKHVPNAQAQIQHGLKNPTYTYRPIQPRPQYRTVSTPAMTVQPSLNIQVQQNPANPNSNGNPNSNPNVIDINRIVPNTGTVTNYPKHDAQLIRKRKSESPDEVHKKLIVPATQTLASNSSITVKRIDNPVPTHSMSVTKVNTSEIGVNTNLPMKITPKIQTQNPRTILQINPIVDQNVRLREELAKPVNVPQVKPQPTMTVTHTSTVMTNAPIEKEKPVRNTVFTQARYRVLADKETPVNFNAVTPVYSNQVAKEMPKVEKKEEKITERVEKPERVVEARKEEPVIEKAETVVEVQVEKAKSDEEVKEKKEEKKVEKVERNAEEKMLSDSMNRLKGTEANELKLKNPKDYILTHVLDGFVIQESNVAFPIRLPLKEKTLAINAAKEKIMKEAIEEARESKTEKVPDLSHLNLTEKENERLRADEQKTQSEDTDGNPFAEVNHSAVKAWTVDQLASHLSKYDWSDTIGVLQEHEIDGESLFLVSKSQLVSIGVKENHADVICEFVKS